MLVISTLRPRFCRSLLAAGVTALIASPIFAFDAGTTDPNSRQIDRLIGSKQCMTEVSFLQASNNLTQLLIRTDQAA
jgi:hypothetical protein